MHKVWAPLCLCLLLLPSCANASSVNAQSYSATLDSLIAGGPAGTYWSGALGYTTPPGSTSFTQIGAGAVAQTTTTKLQQHINLLDYGPIGATCTGSDDSAAFASAAAEAQAFNLTIDIPPMTCLLGNTSALNFTTGIVTLQGQGGGSVIKAMNSAVLSQMIASSATNRLTVSDLVLDGNSANNGTQNSGGSYGIVIQAPHSYFRNVEFRNIARIGVAFFTTSDATFDHVWMHDIGTTATSSDNIGQGIFGIVNDLKVVNSRFENIHTHVSPIGDSNAINICGQGLNISNNYFLNNYNVNGAQLAVSDCSDGSHDIDAIVQGNIVEQTGTFEGDLTAGIEVNGSNAIVANNICQGVGMDCVRLEAHSDGVKVTNNVANHFGSEGSAACVNLINNVSNASITGNICKNGPLGISIPAGSFAAVVADNFFSSTLGAAFAPGTIPNIVSMHDNAGYGYGYLSYVPPTIPAGQRVTSTVTVNGAILTDAVEVAYSRDLQGLILTGWVSSANTVTFELYNPTFASISLSADVMRAWIKQRYN